MDVGSYIDALRNRARKFVSLDTPADADLVDTAQDVGYGFLPVVGTALAARDYERARRDRDYLGMTLSAAGMLPVVGGLPLAANKARQAGKAVGNATEATVAALRKADVAEERMRKSKAFAELKGQQKERAIEAVRAKAEGDAIERSSKAVAPVKEAGEEDIARSFLSDPGFKAAKAIPKSAVDDALIARAELRTEPRVLPKRPEEMSSQEWIDWGKQHGVDMSLSEPRSLGISDLNTRREVMIPGGLEGKFTIPDLFYIKGNNFDPEALPREAHNALMQKFLRTYQIDNPDKVDTFNRLNFALLSPNAPLTQNEFLAQRFRLRNEDELNALADRAGSEGIGRALAREGGVGAATTGGMGVLGTANLGNMPIMADLIRKKPEMFQPQGSETVRDVTTRVMNQVPGLSSKTASLGTPWLDLNKGNTSAVDLWMIRKNYDRMLDDPEVGAEFTSRLAGLTGMRGAGPDAIRAAVAQDPKMGRKVEESAISIIGGTTPNKVYRSAKTGELTPGLPESLSPDKLAYEPKVVSDFNPFYKKVVQYVDESRGPNPDLPLFPEQWRLWDTYRGRVEPHEFAHPDYRKLPRSSWSELQDSLQAHKDAGYYQSGKDVKIAPTDWRRLYYGYADPAALALTAAGAGGAAALINALRKKDEEE